MACFNGDTIPNPLELEPWHEIESFYDSAPGLSPFVQLCRVFNTVYYYFKGSNYRFSVLNYSTFDTAWGLMNYGSTRDPMSDMVSTLQELRLQLIYLSGWNAFGGTPSYIGTKDCYNIGFSNAQSIYNSAMSIPYYYIYYDYTRETILEIMLKIRETLELMYSSPIQRYPWTSGKVRIQIYSFFGSNNGLYDGAPSGNYSFKTTQHRASDIEFIQYLGATGDYYQMQFGACGADELDPYPGGDVCGIYRTPAGPSGSLAVGYGWQGWQIGTAYEDNNPNNPITFYFFEIYVPHNVSVCTAIENGQAYSVNSNGNLVQIGAPPGGWYIFDQATKRFTVGVTVPRGFNNYSILSGIQLPWTTEIKYSGSTPHMSVDAPSGGTFVHPGTDDYEFYFEVDYSMTSANMTCGWFQSKGASLYLRAPIIEVEVCKDACNNWHLGG